MTWRKTLLSPILIFIVFGVVAYLGYTVLIPMDRETIVITPQILEALILQE